MKRILLSCVVLCALSAFAVMIGAAFAYLTDGDTADNVFTVGKVAIDLEEADFKEGAEIPAGGLVPGQQTVKNPSVMNTGENTAYVFLEVTVPTGITAVVDEDRYILPAQETQLFGYTINSDWTLVNNDVEGEAVLSGTDVSSIRGTAGTAQSKGTPFGRHTAAAGAKDGSITYVYAYTGSSRTTCKALEKNESTQELFGSVTFADIVENAGLENEQLKIDITAYAIQSAYIQNADSNIDGINSAGTSEPCAVWKILRMQKPKSDDRTGEDESTDIRS